MEDGAVNVSRTLFPDRDTPVIRISPGGCADPNRSTLRLSTMLKLSSWLAVCDELISNMPTKMFVLISLFVSDIVAIRKLSTNQEIFVPRFSIITSCQAIPTVPGKDLPYCSAEYIVA